jgi:hypothetical protein
MLANPLSQSWSENESVASALVQWINHHHRQVGEARCSATLTNGSAPDVPMLMVELRGRYGLIATYKSSVGYIRDANGDRLLLAPLVVIWNGERPADSARLGHAIVEHLVSAVCAFQASLPCCGRILIASGNLTRAKGGKPFFESLGWQICGSDAQSAAWERCEDMHAVSASIEKRIDCALAPLLKAGKLAIEPISFALLCLDRPA